MDLQKFEIFMASLDLAMNDALRSELVGTHLGDRSTYIGASNIGYCLRRTIGEPFEGFSPDALRGAHAKWFGKVSEDALVRWLGPALPGLHNTGANQMTLVHSTMPWWKTHPDGAFKPDSIPGLEGMGKGIWEAKLKVKDAGFQTVRDTGISLQHFDQVTTNMGHYEATWAIVTTVNGSDILQKDHQLIRFDSENYKRLEARAFTWKKITDMIRSGARPADVLPEGEPERDYCSSCNIRYFCQQAGTFKGPEVPEADLSVGTRILVEMLADEARDLDAEIPWDKVRRLDQIKDELKKALAPTNTRQAAGVRVKRVKKMRLDTEAMKREFPAIYSKYLKPAPEDHVEIGPIAEAK